LPPLPPNEEETLGYGEYASPVVRHQQMVRDQAETERPSGVPLIVLAQQQQLGHDDGSEDVGTPRGVRKSLSTITERTERTEASPHWPSKQQLMSLNIPRLSSSSPPTSYGQIISEQAYFFSDP